MAITLKTCSDCKIDKSRSEFYSKKDTKDGLCNHCKECERVKNKKRRDTPEARAWLKAYQSTPEYKIARKSSDRARNMKPQRKGYMKIYNKTYIKDKLANDPIFKLKYFLRKRIVTAIKKQLKAGSAVRDAGAPMDVVKKHIESLFYGDMAWNNWGKRWQLDHIKSLACFDLTDREQFLKACHYTNLQPLTKEDHRLKTSQQEWRKDGDL